MTWVLPDRVKCLLLPVHRYTRQDHIYPDMMVEEDQRRRILGLAAWKKPGLKEIPAGQRPLLLHGIYVQPGHHRRDIGRRLFGAAEEAVHQLKCDGLLVKLQQDATVLICTEIGTNRVGCLYSALAHHRRESLLNNQILTAVFVGHFKVQMMGYLWIQFNTQGVILVLVIINSQLKVLTWIYPRKPAS